LGTLRVRDHLGDPGVDGRIILRWIFEDLGVDLSMILKWIFKNMDRKAWTGLIWLSIQTDGGHL